MGVGIANVLALTDGVVSLVNAEEKLRKLFQEHGPDMIIEFLDMDEDEATQVADKLGVLDLNNDELEAKIKGAVAVGQKYVVLVLKLLKIVLPKP